MTSAAPQAGDSFLVAFQTTGTCGEGLMADSKLLRAATLDRIGDLVDDTAGVHLRDLPPFTTLLVWTMNSLYRVVVTHWP